MRYSRAPFRALLAAILMRAIRDAHGTAPAGHRRSAQLFLRRGNRRLEDYCSLLDIEPDALLTAVRANGAAWAAGRRVL